MKGFQLEITKNLDAKRLAGAAMISKHSNTFWFERGQIATAHGLTGSPTQAQPIEHCCGLSSSHINKLGGDTIQVLYPCS